MSGKYCVPKIPQHNLKLTCHVICVLASLPVALLGFVICIFTEKYVQKSNFSTILGKSKNKNTKSLKEFTLLTSNVCLLPENVARETNLPNILDRAQKLAKCFADANGIGLQVISETTLPKMQPQALSSAFIFKTMQKTNMHCLKYKCA